MKNRGIRLREIGQDAIDWYIRTGKKDLRTFSQRMTAVMDSPLGVKGANDITHEDIDRWIHGHENLLPATHNRYKTTISRAYSLAMKSHKVRTNPARRVDHQDENNERVRWSTPAEEKRLKAAVASRPMRGPIARSRDRPPHRHAEIRAIQADMGDGRSSEAGQ